MKCFDLLYQTTDEKYGCEYEICQRNLFLVFKFLEILNGINKMQANPDFMFYSNLVLSVSDFHSKSLIFCSDIANDGFMDRLIFNRVLQL